MNCTFFKFLFFLLITFNLYSFGGKKEAKLKEAKEDISFLLAKPENSRQFLFQKMSTEIRGNAKPAELHSLSSFLEKNIQTYSKKEPHKAEILKGLLADFQSNQNLYWNPSLLNTFDKGDLEFLNRLRKEITDVVIEVNGYVPALLDNTKGPLDGLFWVADLPVLNHNRQNKNRSYSGLIYNNQRLETIKAKRN